MGIPIQRAAQSLVAKGVEVIRWRQIGATVESRVTRWQVTPLAEGLEYLPSDDGGAGVDATILQSALVQWRDEGYAAEHGAGWIVPWGAAYQILADPGYTEIAETLGIPAVRSTVPRLRSRGSLTDQDFFISIMGWLDDQGQTIDDIALVGPAAIGQEETFLVPADSWRLLQAIARFARRPDVERDERSQRLAWGEIRRLALAAHARLDAFLQQTVVVTPDRLHIGLRRSEVSQDRLIEVVPGFDGCPSSWLEMFDRGAQVRDRYDIPTDRGVVQIVVTPAVKTVLQQIKGMPGRRVAGPRAQAFVANPFATLGTAASEVIDPDEFEAERSRAGLDFDRFQVYIEQDADGDVLDVGLLIESGVGSDSGSFRVSLSDEEVHKFLSGIRQSIADGCQLFAWKEYEFELLGDVPDQIGRLEQDAGRRRARRGAVIEADTVYDLSMYSARIEGIGEEKPYASPYIARKNDEQGWFPDNLVNLIQVPAAHPGGEPRLIEITERQLEELREALLKARERGDLDVEIPRTPGISVPVNEMAEMLGLFAKARDEAAKGTLGQSMADGKLRQRRKGLLIKPNIDAATYIVNRRDALSVPSGNLSLPQALLPAIRLKQHQIEGVKWLRHLFECSPDGCYGAVLADDMGLGKTLQVLTLIAWAYESDVDLRPALVVAPVALLENWREEAKKFLKPDALPILEVYGSTLERLRVPRAEISEQLKLDGLVRFLKPGWVGKAKLVLTTYETLRDLEFSFAAEKWSIIVCDEAQKIKRHAISHGLQERTTRAVGVDTEAFVQNEGRKNERLFAGKKQNGDDAEIGQDDEREDFERAQGRLSFED